MPFKLNTEAKTSMVTDGIEKHKDGEPAKDPLSGSMYLPVMFTEKDEIKAHNLLGHFPGVRPIDLIVLNKESGAATLVKDQKVRTSAYLIWMLASLSITIATFKYLQSDEPLDLKLQPIPVFFTVSTGIGFTASLFSAMRYKAALDIQRNLLGKHPFSDQILAKIL